MAEPRRIKRLETAILQTVGPLVSHGLMDPRLSMVTVTGIRLTPDLSIARVNWSILGSDADRSKAAHALEHARGYLQAAVAKRIQTRLTPVMEFHFDESLEKAQRVNRLLDQIARERAEREGIEEGAETPQEEESPQEE